MNKILRLKDVLETTGLARATVYKMMTDSSFPKSIALGERSVGWLESEVQEWILAKIEERDAGKA